MTRDELIWLAGWLEGEGCFLYSEHKNNSPKIIIQVFSTDYDVIERAAKIMQSKRVRTMPPRNQSNGGYRTEVQANRAAELMQMLLPFMGKRRSSKIRECLEKWDARPSRPMEKLCACGCGQTIFAGRRTLYAAATSGACAQRAYRARQKEIAV